jgi:1-acyl-sn-glycerol-3-phosphate acyltransferase
MAAAAVRSAGEELLASWLAKDRGKDRSFYTSRIPKQAIYGSLIHIPIANWLLKGARYIFRGRTSPTSRFLAILFGLLVVCHGKGAGCVP